MTKRGRKKYEKKIEEEKNQLNKRMAKPT